MNWWDSQAGKLFRNTMAKATGMLTLVDVAADIYKRSGVNPKVINAWSTGGNPSMSTLNRIFAGYKGQISLSTQSSIIDLTRIYKNQDKEPNAACNQNRLNEIYAELKKFPQKIDAVYSIVFPKENLIKLTARIEDYDNSAKKYIIRVRKENGEFVLRERTSIYEQAKHILEMQSFKGELVKKIETSNYTIDFSWEKSIKKVQ